jgi:hypothetical protein
MAEYYPLLVRAVNNLETSTSQTRQAIYARARKALEAQLGQLNPPNPDLVIREGEALQTAIDRLEKECLALAAKAEDAQREHATQTPKASIDDHLKAGGLPKEVGPPLETAPTPRGFNVPPIVHKPREQLAAGGVDVDESEEQLGGPQDLPSLIEKLKSFGRPKSSSPQMSSSTSSQPRVPADQGARPDDITLSAAPDVTLDEPAEMMRPSAVSSLETSVPRERGFVFAIVIGAVVLAVAIAAYVLRDRPEDIAKLRAAANAERSDQPSAGKISDRIADANTTEQERGAQSAPSAPAVPQVQKAVLILEAPGEENGSKRFDGTITWRMDGINRGPAQEIIPDVRGDIDLPDLKLRVSMVIYKNMDPALSASHIIQLKFEPAADSVFAGISQTDMLAMRSDDGAPPEYLQGIPTPVMTNYFFYALAQNDRAISTNLDLLRTRKQFDLMMRLTNNLRARIAFEKGAGGENVFAEASDVLK